MKVEYHLKEVTEALKTIEKLKGKERAQLIERMARCETAHFTSQQWKLSKSFGMEFGKWSGIDATKFKTFKMNDNHLEGEKKQRTFIAWDKCLDFCLYLSDYIDRYKGDYARWNSITEARKMIYRTNVSKVRNRIII